MYLHTVLIFLLNI